MKMHELRQADACRTRRNFEFQTESAAADYMKKAGYIKKAIRKCLAGEMRPSEVEPYLQEAFADIPYPSDRQRQIHARDAQRQISRYVGSEKRCLLEGVETEVDLGHGLTVTVKPDFVYVGAGNIEVIQLKTSKPNISQAEAHRDLGLYALYLYGKELVSPGKEAVVRASYYFLRKANDSSSTDKPVFDEDFFLLKGGRNIVCVEDAFRNVPGCGITELDKTFEPAVERFMEGLPEEECSKEDCEKCSLYELCKYTDSPLAIVKTQVNKSLADLELTAAQEEVVEYEKGICRVNAGAGAGKTMVVALRTATLINKGVEPKEILLITFTNAGAEEMRSRIRLTLEDFGIEADVGDMDICTFNAFGDKILKAEYAKLGFQQPPKVIDDIERSRIIANLLNTHTVPGLDYRNFTTDMKNCKGALAIAKAVFAAVKAGQYTAGEAKQVREALGSTGRFVAESAIEALIALYDEYDSILRSENLIEFADQEVLLFELLHQEPYYLEQFGYKHIIVDEFQDTSEGQIKLIRMLRECPTFESLMVVGDDSQAIFSFRGTTPEYILNFDRILGAKVDDIMLVENHRSTPEIIEAANQMNATRKQKIDKDLIATRPHGKPVEVQGFLTKQEEQEYVLTGIREHLENGCSPEDIAIITATKYELREMADLLGKEGIQTVMMNPEPLIENSRVRAAIALCRAIRDSHDTEDRLTFANALAGGTLIKASRKEIEDALEDTENRIREYQAAETEAEKKDILIRMLSSLDRNEDEVFQSLLETLKVKPTAKVFEYANDFYEFGSNAEFRRTHSYPGVVLTTAHSSKGLEWPVVYNMISKYDTAELHKHSREAFQACEERKRLLFVSMTRARDELYITGQYVAFGKRGDYTYNGFLRDAYTCAGREPFTAQQVELLRKFREDEKKMAKKAQKEAAAS